MPPWLKRKRVWIPGAALLATGLYAALGFWWAPRLIRNAIVEDGSAALGVPVSVGEVQVHPFTFELTVQDLVVADPAEPLLALERLYLDFELASLWRGAWSFRIVRLNGPFARALVRPDGSLNLADLVPETAPEAEAEPLPSLHIERLVVSRGQVNFADRSRRQQPEKILAPIQFDLADFRTTPEGGDFTLTATSEAGERFDWKGRMSAQPVGSQGEFQIHGLKARSVWEFTSEDLPFELGDGEIDLAGSYDFRLDGGTHLEASLPTITGTGLSLRETTNPQDRVVLPQLTVTGTRLSWAQGTVDIDSVAVDGAKVVSWREADGRFSIERLLEDATAAAPEPDAAAEGPGGGASPSPAPTQAPPVEQAPEVVIPPVPADAQTPREVVAEAAPDWQVRLKTFTLSDAQVEFEDRMLQPALPFRIAPLSITATGIDLDLAHPVPVQIAGRIDDRADFTAAGNITPETFAADLEVTLSGLDLPKLQPYFDESMAADITAGVLSAKGRVLLAPEGETPWLKYTGEAAVDGFSLVDHLGREELVRWQRTELDDMELALGPDALRVRRITARRPYLRVVIAPDRTVNLVRAMADRNPQAKLVDAVANRAARPTEAAAMAIDIAELRFVAATMGFSDHFIEPNFNATIESLDGSVRGLSSNERKAAKVDLTGFVVNKFSPVIIQGEVNPFRYDLYTDLKLQFRNIDLPVFNPYSGRYAGFAIAKGKLTTELDYKIRDRQLVADHHVVLDQLEWGEATDSQEKVSLPIRLATSLLKNRDGVIDLSLPVTGSLDDPKFRVGPVVWQIVKNLLVKVVTAPFDFLGSLFKGAENAQFVVFEPGLSTLTPEQQQSLGALAQGLAEKPELRVEVPAGLVPELDREAIARQRLDAALAAAAKTEEGEAFDFEALDIEDRIDLLRDVYKQQFGQRAKIPDEAEPPEDADRDARRALREAHEQDWLTAELMPKFAPTEPDLTALGQARAEQIQKALLAGGQLPPERVFVTSAKPVTAADGQVKLELGLE